MMNGVPRNESRNVHSLFPNAVTLLEYLSALINVRNSDNIQNYLLLDSDTTHYRDLLLTSMIVPEAEELSEVRGQYSLPVRVESFPIKEAVNRIVSSLVRQNQSYKEQNCLTLGYRQKSGFANAAAVSSMRSNIDVECYFVNTIQPLVSTRAWELLANRIGESVLHHIFQRPVFLRSKNGCYLQVSGTPASELIYQMTKGSQVKSNIISPHLPNSLTRKRSLSPSKELHHATSISSKISRTTSEPGVIVSGGGGGIASLRRASSINSTATLVDGRMTAATSSSSSSASETSGMIAASQSLPRYQLFYRSHYQKSIGLPTSHIFTKSMSGEALVYSLFKNLLYTNSYLSPSSAHLKSHLSQMLKAADAAYKKCDVSLLIHLYCPLNCGKTNNSNSNQATSSTLITPHKTTPCIPQSIPLGQVQLAMGHDPNNNANVNASNNNQQRQSSFKKTRRGCRSGLLVKKRSAFVPPTEVSSKVTSAINNNNNSHSDNDNVEESNILLELIQREMTTYYFDDFHYQSQELTPELEEGVGNEDGEGVEALDTTSVVDGEGKVEIVKEGDEGNEPKMGKNRRKKLKRKLRLEQRKEELNEIRTLLFVDNTSNEMSSTLPSNLTTATTKKKEPLSLSEGVDLLTLNCSHTSVSSFVKAVLIKTFDYKSVWGSRRNQDVFLSGVESYISLARHETVTVAQVIQRISLSEIPWLNLSAVHAAVAIEEEEKGKKKKTSREEHQLLQQVFYVFMYWLYADFINPLLSACFYITEIDGHKFDCCYYRQPIWSLIVRKGLQQMRSNFIPVELYNSSVQTTNNSNSSNNNGSGGQSMFRTTSHTENRMVNTNIPSSSAASSTLALNDLVIDNKYRFQPSSPTASRSTSPLKKVRRDVSEQTVSTSSSVMTYTSSSTATNSNNIANSASTARVRNYLQRIPRLRFVPKKNAVRALTNLKSSRRSNNNNGLPVGSLSSSSFPHMGEVLTNSALFNCLHVLKHIYSSNPLLGGFGTFGIDDIYIKFRKYLQTIRHQQQQQQLLLQNQRQNRVIINSIASTALSMMTSLTGGSASSLSGSVSTTSPSLGAAAALAAADCNKYYVAVLDLEKCYDNVNKDFLFGIVQKMLLGEGNGPLNTNNSSSSSSSSRLSNAMRRNNSESATATVMEDKSHLIHRYSVSHSVPSLDKKLSKTVRYVTSSDDVVSFQEASEEIARCYRNSVIGDGVVYSKITNQEILKLLRIHLFSHVVRIPAHRGGGGSTGNHNHNTSNNSNMSSKGCDEVLDVGSKYNYFTQVKGIPQGSVLSPLLCNIYYGHIENELFNNDSAVQVLGLTDKSVIIRLIDDYIMISTEQSCVQHFLQLAHVSLKAFGGGVNPLKTKVNFDTSILIDGTSVHLHNIHSHMMPWCGLFVNTRTLEISPNFGRFLERPIVSSILVEYHKSGKALCKAIKSYLRTKCDAIVLDRTINSKLTVLTTLYSMYLIAAMRSHNYVNKLRLFGSVVNPSFLFRSICEGLVFGSRLLHTRTKRKKCKVLHIGGENDDNDDNEEDEEANDDDDAEEGDFGQNYHYYYSDDKSNNSSSSSSSSRSLFEQCISMTVPNAFGECEITNDEALWLGLSAFIAVLNRRKSLYNETIKLLSIKLKQIEVLLVRKGVGIPSSDLFVGCCDVAFQADWM